MKYFDKLPLINYNGKVSRNILSRAQLTPETRNNTSVFYPYTMEEADRADTLSYLYYDNSDYMWLIWMANNVVDPYHDLPLSENDFTSFIANKYGSMNEAAQQIKYWRNEWAGDESILTPAQYQALEVSYDEQTGKRVNKKKYYDPVLDIYFNISGYKRKQVDWLCSTNKTVTFQATVTGTPVVGERVSVNSNNFGYVVNVDGTTVILQHIIGSFALGNTLTGSKSGATINITNTPYVQTNIPDEEIMYWNPVSMLDYERLINDKKKELTLVDARYKQVVADELARVMNR